ncbi:MAG TPA: aldo/keto reductase [Rhabdaerophilum sp.]|nr:aldo/keto reductase [Rhabdaerophilum sp.]
MTSRFDAQLGLGLVGIGRPWGAHAAPPAEADVRRLLEAAFTLGVKVFDTAPAYGTSERLLGAFLRTLTREEREGVFIATKFGEHWNDDGTTRVDHSYEALMRSLDRSVELLRDIDLLQVHKASRAALENSDLRWALEAAQAMDIPQFGASVSDSDAGRLAIGMGFHWLQFPYNRQNTALADLLPEARAADIRLMTNRPLATGAMLADKSPEARATAARDAYAFVLEGNPDGVVLGGTTSPAHLEANFKAFNEALALGER